MQDLGLSASRMVAGFAGGLLYSFAVRDRDPWSIVTSVTAGALVANYLSDATAHYVPSFVGPGGVSFLTGLTAMAICQGVIAFARVRFRVAVRDEEDLREEKP